MALPSAKPIGKLDAKRLPALPHALLKLLAGCDDDRITLADIATVIGTDAALSARVLAVTRSPLFRVAGEVSGIERALVVLGLEMVKSIALAAAVVEAFRETPPAVDLPRFWRHSLLAAQVAASLAQRVHYPQTSEAYLSGLLHDVGELVLAMERPDDYLAVVSLEPDEARRATAERTRFGESHAEVSARLADSWRLSSFMGDALAFHHEAAARIASSHPLVRIVRLAHTLAAPEWGEPLPEELALCGLAPDEASAIREEALLKVAELGEALGIDLKTSDLATPSDLSGKRIQLADEVSALTLMTSARERLASARDQKDVLHALRRSFELLFDVSGTAFFMARDDGAYSGLPLDAEDALIAELVIPTRDPGSAAARAIRDREPLLLADVGDPGISVLDRQIARMLHAAAVVLLPLVARDEVIGLAACGVEPDSLSRTRNRLRVLGVFTRQAAATLAGRIEEKLVRPAAPAAATPPAGGAGRLAARRMAHEVNNPLAIMKNYVGVLRMKLTEGHPAQDDLRVVSEEIDRVARIIREFATAQTSDSTAPATVETSATERPADVAAIVADLLRLTTPTLLAPRNIRAVSRIDAKLPALSLDPDTIKQALLNLVKNAAEAMDNGGTITLGARPILLDNAPWAEVTVSDTGPGLPRNVQGRLFQPVASGKGGDHQGLGLSIVKSLVSQLGGIVSVDTTSNGTQFRILLPAPPPGGH